MLLNSIESVRLPFNSFSSSVPHSLPLLLGDRLSFNSQSVMGGGVCVDHT